jgi:phosphoglycolate phosphatase
MLIVFDLDGTLVDSRRDLADAANQVLGEHGIAPHSEDAIGRMVGDGAAMLVARAFAAAAQPEPPDALVRFLEIYNSRLLTFTAPYPGIRELLDELSSRVTLAVLTNKPLAATVSILEGLELSRHFEERVVGGDGPLPRKPDPGGLRHLMGLQGVSGEQTLMVGDSVIDWRTAHSAQAMSCIARYGFGFAGFPVAQITPADRIIDHPDDLLVFL